MSRRLPWAVALSLTLVLAALTSANDLPDRTSQTPLDFTSIAPKAAPAPATAADPAVNQAVQRLLGDLASAWRPAAAFLARHATGRPVLEELIIRFRASDDARWQDAFLAYVTNVPANLVSERMVPEYVADLQLQQTCQGTINSVERLGMLGKRGAAALPALEYLHGFSLDPQQVESTTEAITLIKGLPSTRIRMTGC
jgi:hypothetical protein